MYYGFRDPDKPASLEGIIYPILWFTLALVVGQSIVEWVDRMEWRVKLREGAAAARKEKEKEETKESTKAKSGSSKGTSGSTKKKN